MAKMSAAELVEEYADSIIMQRQAVHAGNARKARYYGNRRAPIAKRLVQMGDQGIRAFAVLLNHPDMEIRATAAVHLISSIPEPALAVFRDLVETNSPLALPAKMRIKEWEEHPEHYDPENWAK